jgi:hypothetical protein
LISIHRDDEPARTPARYDKPTTIAPIAKSNGRNLARSVIRSAFRIRVTPTLTTQCGSHYRHNADGHLLACLACHFIMYPISARWATIMLFANRSKSGSLPYLSSTSAISITSRLWGII